MLTFSRTCHCIVSILLVLLFLSGCAGLPDNSTNRASTALQDTGDTKLGAYFKDEKNEHKNLSGFYLLNDGLDAFVARAVLIQIAEKSLDLQYYLYHPDLVGGMLADLMIKAADRGVRVRLLLDDMGLAGRDADLSTLAQHPNIEIRIFNPFLRTQSRAVQFITRFGSVTRRMHNKSLTADNQVTIVGGRNIGNEYFAVDPSMVFGDIDVLSVGPVVQEVSASFDTYWNSPLAYPVNLLDIGRKKNRKTLEEIRPLLSDFVQHPQAKQYLGALSESDLAQTFKDDSLILTWGKAKFVADQPEKLLSPRGATQYQLAPLLHPLVEDLDKEFIILSAYFVPGKEGVEFFRRLRERGVTVRILTNSLASTDVGVVHTGYAKYRKDLLRAGVELYEVAKDAVAKEFKKQRMVKGASKASLHAKSYVFDRRYLFIGSFNLDPRSIEENTELGIVFESKELAGEIAAGFDRGRSENVYRLQLRPDGYGGDDLEWVQYRDGEERILRVEPGTSFFQRLMISLLSFLPLESQL